MKPLFAVVLILIFIIMLGAWDVFGNHVSTAQGTMVAQTQTASMWTPVPVAPSVTPVPKQAFIVNTLNSTLQQEADPLEKTLDAKFTILDIVFDSSGNPPVSTTMEIHVECEWIKRPSCTEQRAFVALANAFKKMKPGIRKKIKDEIPGTITTVQVRAFDHMNSIGMIEIGWRCLMDFADGNVTGDQLAARALQFSHP